MTDANVNRQWDSDETSSSVLNKAKQNDPGAWDRIVECYGGMVYRWCLAAQLSPDTARDIGQEVFLAAYRNLDGFSPRKEVGSFRSWLRTITKSKVSDHFRRVGDGLPAPGGSEAKEQMEQVEFPEDDEESINSDLKLLYAEVVKYVKSQFSENDFQAFYRVTAKGEAPADVAQSLGITRNSVYLACARIKKRVREQFGDLLGDESPMLSTSGSTG